jgi:hypothetical protein
MESERSMLSVQCHEHALLPISYSTCQKEMCNKNVAVCSKIAIAGEWKCIGSKSTLAIHVVMKK